MDRISLYMCLSVSPPKKTSASFRETQIRTGRFLSCQLTFHQRPDIRAPKYEFTYYDRDAATPGYIFTAPYGILDVPPVRPEFLPCQVGPHIYDMDGVSVCPGSRLMYGLTLPLGTRLERSVPPLQYKHIRFQGRKVQRHRSSHLDEYGPSWTLLQ